MVNGFVASQNEACSGCLDFTHVKQKLDVVSAQYPVSLLDSVSVVDVLCKTEIFARNCSHTSKKFIKLQLSLSNRRTDGTIRFLSHPKVTYVTTYLPGCRL